MAGLNKASLIGHLGKDPETTYSKSDMAITKFSLATTETVKKEKVTTWHNIVTFGKLAEICKDFLKKGKQVYIEGRIQNGSYENKDGVRVYTSEIIAHTMLMLGSSSERPVSEPKIDSSKGAEVCNETIPF